MNTSSISAALLLCAVVLGSFFVLRNYGPESTVRRFHFAVQKNDQAALRSICTGDDAAVYVLSTKLKRLYTDRAQIMLGRVNDDDPNQVVAQFIYRTPNYTYTINWVVDHTRAGWKVNAEATLMGPFGYPPGQQQQQRSNAGYRGLQ